MRNISTTIAALCWSGAAAAADFTFDVPVRVQNAPGLETLYVNCRVSRVPSDGATPWAGSNVIGEARASVFVRSGNYDGTVTVEVENRGIIPSSSARSYSCSLDGVARAATGRGVVLSSGTFRDGYETVTGHRLDRLTTRVRGDLP
jgi:hypothetical protein